MSVRTTIVLSNDNDHTIETSSHGLRLDSRTAMLHVHGDGNYVMAAATHELEKKDHKSAVASHGFGAKGDVPNAKNHTVYDVLISQNTVYWKQRYAADAVQKIAQSAAMFGSVVYSHQPRVT